MTGRRVPRELRRDRALVRFSPSLVEGVDVGGDHQRVGADVRGQAGAGVVLVDHAFDTHEAPAGR